MMDPIDVFLKLQRTLEVRDEAGIVIGADISFGNPREDLFHPGGMQGGFVASFCEASMFHALRVVIQSDTSTGRLQSTCFRIVDLASRCIRQGRRSPVLMKARVKKLGRKVAFCESHMFQDELLIASSSACFCFQPTTATQSPMSDKSAAIKNVPELKVFDHQGQDAVLKLMGLSPFKRAGASDNECCIAFEGREQFCRYNSDHALELQTGAATCFLDAGSGWGVQTSTQGRIEFAPSLDFKVTVLAPMGPGKVYTKATYVARNEETLYMEASLHSVEDDTLLARICTSALLAVTPFAEDKSLEQRTSFLSAKI